MKTNIPIEQATAVVKANFEVWKEKWRERSNLLKDVSEEVYSKHILSILPDLIEEVEYNEKRFSTNEYAKNFFHANLVKHLVQRRVQDIENHPFTQSQVLATEIQNELLFVLESLQSNVKNSSFFWIPDLTVCLHRMDAKLRTTVACDRVTKSLMELLCREEEFTQNNSDIIYLCDTLILLFARNGSPPGSIESVVANVFSGLQKFDNGNFYSPYPGSPEKESLSNEEYGRRLVSFFRELTIEDRFNEISRLYALEPEEYEVIFKVDGFEKGTSGFSMGDVTVYNPKEQSRIKVDSSKGRIAKRVEEVSNNELCVAVKVRGTDTSSMKLGASRKAERALGLITTRKSGRKTFNLSNVYAICDSEGNEVAFGFAGRELGVFHPENLVKWREKEYERFGSWINREPNRGSIGIWLASMDWYRKATESEQSSDVLLNAWYSIEHLFQGKTKVSLRIPGFLRNRPNEKQTHVLWYADERVAQIQLILSLVEAKHELSEYAAKTADTFLPSSKTFFSLRYGKQFALSADVLRKFVEEDGLTYTGRGFVAASDKVISELKSAGLNDALSDVQCMRDLFFDKETAMNKLRNEIWRIKDDVYNMYRIRNMLVHRAMTDSVLTEYYGTRAVEYSLSLLTELKWNLLRTKDDSEIRSIDEYFQEWVLDSNIGLEAIQSGDMSGFRKWVFS